MRLSPASLVVLALCAGPALLYSQDNPAPADPASEMRSMHELLEQQSHQLETLTQQVAKLSALIESTHSAPAMAGAAPAAENMPPVQETNPAAASSPEAPKAEAVDIGTTHVVTRGETLTSIAKKYKVSVGDLQKTNNIKNDRTLQIGQTLTIPAPKTGDSHNKEKQ